MDEERLRRLKAIMVSSPCPVGCRCHKARPEDLCKAKSMGIDALLESLEERPEDCTFAVAFGGSHFCRCGTRKEIAKLLGE